MFSAEASGPESTPNARFRSLADLFINSSLVPAFGVEKKFRSFNIGLDDERYWPDTNLLEQT